MASSLPLNGYLYIAYGEQHVNEALVSIKSLRRVDKKSHVTIITDRDVDGFDQVIKKKKFCRGFAGKVDNLTNQYYSKTFFVDTDTYFCEDCSELFKLLEYYDLCAMLDPAEVDVELIGLTSYNTGVLLMSDSYRMSKLLSYYKKYYNDKKMLKTMLKGHPAERYDTDQPAFTLAIRDTDIKVHPLSDIWNARYRFNISLMGRVKLIHGPSIDFERLRNEMNYSTNNRIWKGKR